MDYRNGHPRFEEAIQRAIARAIEKHLALILEAAENGSVAESKWYLEHCHPEHFSRNRLEVTGENGSPLALAVGIYLPAKNGNGELRQVLPALIEDET